MKTQQFIVSLALIQLFSSYPSFANVSISELRSVMTEQEKKIDDLRAREIQGLTAVLKRRAPGDQPPELLSRLGEIYVEASRAYYLKEHEVAQKNGTKPDLKTSRGYLKGAIESFESVLKLKNRPAKVDDVLYRLGFYYDSYGDKAASLKYYRQLVEKYPESEYAAEGYLALGDEWFGKEKWNEAMGLYNQAAKSTESRFYTRVLYKVAWCYYRLQNYQQAIYLLKRVVEIEEADNQNHYVKMKDAVLPDLAMFYTDAGNPEEAKEYLRAHGGEKEYLLLLKRLSATFERKGMYESAAKINSEIVSLTKSVDERLDYRLKNLRMYQRERLWPRVIVEYKSLLAEFGPNSEYGKSVMGSADRQAYLQQIESGLRSISTSIHREAQKTQNTGLYKTSTEFYKLYLTEFPSTKFTSEIRYYYVDTLIQAKDMNGAVEQLKQIMASTSPSDEKFKHDSQIMLLGLLSEEVKKYETKDKGALTQVEKDYIASAEGFLISYPKDPKSDEIMFSISKIFYRRGLMPQAFERNERIIRQFPKSKVAVAAAKMNIDIKIESKDPMAIQKLAAQYRNDKLIGTDDEFKGKLDSIIQQTSFQQVADLEKTQNYDKAGKEYERLAMQSPSPDIKQKSLNNAIANYEKAGRSEDVFRLMTLFVQQFPKSPQADNFRFVIPQRDFTSLKFERAADSFESYAQHSNENPKAPDAALTAGLINEALGRNDKAVSNFGTFLKIAPPRDARREAVYFRMVEGYQKLGNRQKVSSLLKDYLTLPNTNRVMEAFERLAEVSGESRIDSYKKALAVFKSSRSARENYYAGLMKFTVVSPMVKQFQAIRLELPTQKLKASIAQKLSLQRQIQDEYVKVIKFGAPEWIVASFNGNASVLEDFRQSIVTAPVPPGLNPDQMKQYNKALTEQTDPLLKSALQNYVEGFKNAGKYLVVGDMVDQVYRSSVRLKSREVLEAVTPLGSFSPTMSERYR